MTSRRGFILGLGAALAAPAIVKAESLMKIAKMRRVYEPPLIVSGRTATEVLNRVLMQLAPPRPLSTTFPTWQLLLYDTKDGFRTTTIDPEEIYARPQS